MMGVFVYLAACINIGGVDVCWTQEFKTYTKCGTAAGGQGALANSVGIAYRYGCYKTMDYV